MTNGWRPSRVASVPEGFGRPMIDRLWVLHWPRHAGAGSLPSQSLLQLRRSGVLVDTCMRQLLIGIGPLRPALDVVLAHHERWDGAGYPLGLRGEAIPLSARLFGLADAFDAITSDRPYRSARHYDEARAVIHAEAGKQFDPLIVQAFLSVLPSEWETIRLSVERDLARWRQDRAVLLNTGYDDIRTLGQRDDLD